MIKSIITTFYLDGRIKTYSGNSELENLNQFLDDYSEAQHEIFKDKNKIVSAFQIDGEQPINFKYLTKEEKNNFFSCKFKSSHN